LIGVEEKHMNAFDEWQRLQDQSFLYQAVRADGEESYWSRYARNYDLRRHAGDGLAAELDRVTGLIEPSWNVLEIGAGTGAFTLPVARKAASVTVVEPSPAMATILEEKLRDNDIGNVVVQGCRWQEVAVGVHDVVLAAGCIYVFYDIAAALAKMAEHARRRVILTSGTHNTSAIYNEAARALGVAPPAPGPDYLDLHRVLCRMGMHPDIAVLRSRSSIIFDDPEHAINVWAERLKLTPDQTPRLRAYFGERLRPLPSGQWTLGEVDEVRAVLWWPVSGAFAG
jgi:SAM-dependent methyltransferase